jgi:hypothetical protein
MRNPKPEEENKRESTFNTTDPTLPFPPSPRKKNGTNQARLNPRPQIEIKKTPTYGRLINRMVRTRLDTKFKNWSFVLRDDEMFICLYALSHFCEKISYEYCTRHGYSVNCAFTSEQRYDDVVEDISYFAKDIYPRLKYVHMDELPMRVLSVPSRPSMLERYHHFAFWMVMYIITVVSALVAYCADT